MAHYILKQTKDMQCIVAIACLKHAMERIVKYTNIIEAHTVGWNKHFFSANLLFRFLAYDKGSSIFISGLCQR